MTKKKRSTKKKLSLPEQENCLRLFTLQLMSAEAAAARLGVSRSTLYRRASAYAERGCDALRHGNTGRAPQNKMSREVHDTLVTLLSTKYDGFQPAMAVTYLERDEHICVSRETIRRILREISPPAEKKVRRIHGLRQRRHQFGDLIQIDGSPHRWFESDDEEMVCLIAFIDDATGLITASQFFPTESAAGYLTVLEQHVRRYGIPVAFYSDRHSIFSPVADDRVSQKTYEKTQYQRVCDALGIEQILALSPEAKGRIERLFRTLQNRWPKEFRLRGVTTMEEANRLLPEFIEAFNKTFSVRPFSSEDAHVKVPEDSYDDLHRLCALWYSRRLSAHLVCRFQNCTLQVLGKAREWELARQEVFIVEYADGKLEMVWKDRNIFRLLPFEKSGKPQVDAFEKYSTAKTLNADWADRVRTQEQSRRLRWINRRREEADKALNAMEREVQEKEARVEKSLKTQEDPEKIS